MVASEVMGQCEQADFIVMGAGVAGLRAAVELASHGTVLVLTKEAVAESNTHYAQGGIAVAMEGSEDVALHLQDTIAAGDGLVSRHAAEVLVAEGPQRVKELIDWGAHFDTQSGRLLKTREAAHSVPRILHADGDATGAEISRSLASVARANPAIRFCEWTTVSGLVLADGSVAGVDYLDRDQSASRIAARAVLIAAGGAGQVYSDTTNPGVATGDGIALASWAGAELADMEFYQFHPTALYLPGAPRFLLSEALRGEGAYLRNDRGERFMERYHPALELAPRDVVARAVGREAMSEGNSEERAVYLDMRHVQGIDLHKRFPGISALLAQYGLDLHRDLIPIRPAAHYLMGGIRTDLHGRTSTPGLYAAGEAACTGVHGANRLASNSLLEGLVFGARAAKAMLETNGSSPKIGPPLGDSKIARRPEDEPVHVLVKRVRKTMWEHAGLLRNEESLGKATAELMECEAEIQRIAHTGSPSRRLTEAKSLCAVAKAILNSAQARQESRGAHYRSDYPRRDERYLKHSIFRCDETVTFEEW